MQLTSRDAARLLNISERTLHRWIDEKGLPVHNVNDQLRFNRAELLEWATAQKITISVSVFEEALATETTLVDALKAGGIVRALRGSDAATLTRSLVDAMRLPADVDRETIFEILSAKEGMGVTPVGEGIAIPHVRNPLVVPVKAPVLTLCFLERPVDLGAFDGQAVRVLFALLCPNVRTHLYLLSRLAFALRDKAFKEAIAKSAADDDLFREAGRIESRFTP